MSQRLEHAISHASEGHDDYMVSLALTTQAASDPLPRPRVALERIPVPALN